MFNLYTFKVVFADGSRGMRNIPQNTYGAALNDLYFPSTDFDHIQPVDEAQLIGLRVGSTWKGDNALSNAAQFDHVEPA